MSGFFAAHLFQTPLSATNFNYELQDTYELAIPQLSLAERQSSSPVPIQAIDKLIRIGRHFAMTHNAKRPANWPALII